MSDAQFDVKVFSRHVKKIHDGWKDGSWNGLDVGALTFVWGKGEEEDPSNKTVALHSYLFQYELPETILVFTKNHLYMVSGKKKIEMMQTLKSSSDYECPFDLTLFPLNKPDGNKSHYDAILSALPNRKLGTLTDVSGGWMVSAWKEATADYESVDISRPVANILAIKDEQEIKCIRTSASITSAVMKSSFVPKLESVVDAGKATDHATLSEQVAHLFENPEKISSKLNPDVVDSCYPPVVQSGGEYDLSWAPQSSSGDIHDGVIILGLAARYKSYCSMVARTYLIDPAPAVQANYNFLLQLHQKALDLLHPGTECKHIYKTLVSFIQESEKHKGLASHFLEDCGAGIGLELVEKEYLLNAKNNNKLKKNMVVTLRLGFQDLEVPGEKDPQKQKYALYLCDTILLTDEGATELTTAKKGTNDVFYFFDDEEKEKKPSKKDGATKVKKEKTNEGDDDAPQPRKKTDRDRAEDAMIARDRVLRGKNAQTTQAAANEMRRKEHQRALANRQKEEAARKYSEGGAVKQEKGEKKFREYVAYRSAAEFPREAQRDKIHVDTDREALLLPIHGQLVPFHITTVKSVTKTEDYLRIIFKTPGSGVTDIFKNPNAHFIKELTFRVPRAAALNNAFRLINELKKRVTARESEKAIVESLTEQEVLQRSAVPGPRLANLNIRPTLGGGRRTLGILEAHENGFRFTTAKKGTVDIIYKNIKHAFFQPAENELIVLLHLRLHHAIMVGKKKTNDVQFFTEVMEASQALGARGAWGDQDELEEEQRERETRTNLNNQFQQFVKRVEAFKPDLIEFDIPYRELGFHGVPGRNNVFLQPTVHCLVNLIEAPFFVMTLDEVEIAYFERVAFGLKQFDIVFVNKDWAKPTVHVNAVPIDSLETIKDWLDSCNIKYYEGNVSLNWKSVMQKVRDDPKGFWEDGGWDFLEGGDSDEENREEDEESEEDEFVPGGDGDDEDDGSDESDFGGSDDDSDDYSGSDDDDDSLGSGGDDEDDSEGEDWDALERKAANDDKRRMAKRKRDEDGDGDDDDEKNKKRKK